jgi:hypothetical protein
MGRFVQERAGEGDAVAELVAADDDPPLPGLPDPDTFVVGVGDH